MSGPDHLTKLEGAALDAALDAMVVALGPELNHRAMLRVASAMSGQVLGHANAEIGALPEAVSGEMTAVAQRHWGIAQAARLPAKEAMN